jgi:hypothetical protein
MMIAVYLGLIDHAEHALANSFRHVADGHADEPDVYHLCRTLASQCDKHRDGLVPVIDRYGEHPEDEPDRLYADGLSSTRTGPVGLLRDLQDVYLLASLVDITWAMIKQAAMGLRDTELVDVVSRCEGQTKTQLAWLTTRMKQAAPQALIMGGS